MGNLVDYFPRFTESDRRFLVSVLNWQLQMQLHIGSLPFVHRGDVIEALKHHKSGKRRAQTVKKCIRLLRLLDHYETTNVESFTMKLDDSLIAKYGFGKDFSNMILPTTMHVIREAGQQWQHFKKEWVKPEKSLRIQLELKRLEPGLWEVKCPAGWTEKAKEYCFDRLGDGRTARNDVLRRINRLETRETKATKAQQRRNPDYIEPLPRDEADRLRERNRRLMAKRKRRRRK